MTPGKQGVFHHDCRPTRATRVKLPRKGKLFHQQEGTRRVRRAYVSQQMLLPLFALLPAVSLKAMEEVSSALRVRTKARYERRAVIYQT